jgi:hypothetical protein
MRTEWAATAKTQPAFSRPLLAGSEAGGSAHLTDRLWALTRSGEAPLRRRLSLWPDNGAQEPRTPVWRQSLAHDCSSGLRGQLDRVNDSGVAAVGDAGRTCGAEVANPADLAEGRLHEPPLLELHHRDWRAVQPAA